MMTPEESAIPLRDADAWREREGPESAAEKARGQADARHRTPKATGLSERQRGNAGAGPIHSRLSRHPVIA